jgi:hypothetical protein
VAGANPHLELFFAGIRFAFEGPAVLLEALAHVPCTHSSTGWASPGDGGVAHVCCAVAPLAGLELAGGDPLARRLEWAWQGGRALLRSRHARAELHGAAEGARAEARLTPNRRGAESLLTGLAAALLHRSGGAILHAASLELPEGVIAIIGPSGSGKSTASRQLDSGRVFSVDRLAVAPRSQDWHAFPLPGGTRSPLDLPPATSARAPLRAVLRIRKAASGACLEPCSPAQAVALLRQSAFHSGYDAQAERELLAHLERLSDTVPVANLHSSLGTMLGPVLGRWLAHRPTTSS